MKRLIIVGAGALGKQIAHHALATKLFEPIGFYDDFCERNSIFNGLKVLGKIEEIISDYKKGFFDVMIVGVGYNHMKKRQVIFDTFRNRVPFATIIHPSAFVDKTAQLGDGSVIYPSCCIDMNVVIGTNVILYNNSNISHDSCIEENSIISPNVSIAGFSNIRSNSVLGIGTIVSDNISIANNVRTGAGTVVITNITEPGLYVGCPARKIKHDSF